MSASGTSFRALIAEALAAYGVPAEAIERECAAMSEVQYAVPAEAIERECAAMSDVQYARTDDRSTVGVLTEFQRLLHGDLEYFPTATLTELSLRLAQTPIVARHAFPEDETCRMFGVPLPRHGEKEIGN